MPYRQRKRKGAKLNKRQATQVKKIIAVRQELKYFQYATAGIAVSASPTIISSPFLIPQGDTDQSRDGDRLMWAGKVDLRVEAIIGSSDPYNNVRLILFQWHPNSTPAVEDLLLDGPSEAPDLFSQFNHDKRQEYKILFDKTWKLVGNGSSASVPYTQASTTGIKRFKISLKKARKQVQFAGGGTTGTNKLYLMYMSDSAVTPHPSISYTTKVFFRDS